MKPTIYYSSIPPSKEEGLCEQYFTNTCKNDYNGNYIVSVPFRTQNLTFPGMRDYAQSLIYSLYKNFTRDYLAQGHMEKLNSFSNSIVSCYLVHHCVLRPESFYTRLRVVFITSAKIIGQKSLNECLMTGPKLQSDIFKMLLNCRLFGYSSFAPMKDMPLVWTGMKNHQ